MNIDSNAGYRPEFDAAARIAHEAGTLLLDMQAHTRQIGFKGQSDLVTDADRAAEELITRRLTEAFPEDGVLAEESGYSELAATADRLWVVDPLDGTTNYAHGLPIYAVSIALVVSGRVEVGAVYMPPLTEMFAAERGRGAWLNDKPISVSNCEEIQNALLCSGFPYKVEDRPRSFEHWRAFTMSARAVRRLGSAAYDLCCVACGRLDGYWELGPSAWDLAAGSLLVTEAGGIVTRYEMDAFDLFGREVLATCPGIHRQMSSLLMGS